VTLVKAEKVKQQRSARQSPPSRHDPYKLNPLRETIKELEVVEVS
jgi:hypothetical protein